ncbi:MAG: hypothetical protein ACI9O3_001447, partial [Colwellia sp.]
NSANEKPLHASNFQRYEEQVMAILLNSAGVNRYFI